jgi:hypothetical protein
VPWPEHYFTALTIQVLHSSFILFVLQARSGPVRERVDGWAPVQLEDLALESPFLGQIQGADGTYSMGIIIVPPVAKGAHESGDAGSSKAAAASSSKVPAKLLDVGE